MLNLNRSSNLNTSIGPKFENVWFDHHITCSPHVWNLQSCAMTDLNFSTTIQPDANNSRARKSNMKPTAAFAQFVNKFEFLNFHFNSCHSAIITHIMLECCQNWWVVISNLYDLLTFPCTMLDYDEFIFGFCGITIISNYMFSVFMHRFPVRCQMIDIYNVHRPWTLNQRNINVIAIEFEAPLKKLATVPSTIGYGPVREWFAPDDVQESSALLNWNKLVFNMFAASYNFPGSPATGACKKDVSKGRRPGFKANKERQICILPIMWHSSTNSCTEALVAGSYTLP